MTTGHAAYFDDLAKQAHQATNLGVTRDVQDLYQILDDLSAYIAAHLPPLACKAGCSSCCHHPPLVTAVEWAALYRHIRSLPASAQQAIVSLAESLRPMSEIFDAARAAALGRSTTRPDKLVARCPLLVDDRCAAYDVRPVICRVYGQSAKKMGNGVTFMGSNQAIDHLKKIGGPIEFPNAMPYLDRVKTLNAGSTLGYIPQWLWAHIDQGQLVPELRLTLAD
jgi:Fe-S-cluster containining protein